MSLAASPSAVPTEPAVLRGMREIPTHAPDGRPRSAEEIEREWFETVYAGDRMPQLTWRAIGMGALLGCVMSLTNIYVGLKTGWSLGVAITACILSYSIWKALRAVLPGVIRSDFSILEN